MSPPATVALVGAMAAMTGIALRDTLGASESVTAAGIGMMIGGAAYAASAGPDWARLGLTVLALVSVQLLAFGGVLRWIGVAGVGAVLAGIAYGRYRR
jgi:hypothetical protein